ncbi:hypothetical protein CHS0354_004204 [Potamilus streckersoni]|uniref:Mitochondria-eating protein n=1 Tax=Potamilus streckersoni TaxID=2493646 RepID=A0AAE0VIN8_9BIVA|nr:hypothetical protein CHS0354_004204 [Potamilus streckersoni]
MGNTSRTMTNIDDVEQEDLIGKTEEETDGIQRYSKYEADSSYNRMQEQSSFCWKCLLCLCGCRYKRHSEINRKRDSNSCKSSLETQNDRTIDRQEEIIAQLRLQNSALEQEVEELKNENQRHPIRITSGQEEMIAQLHSKISSLEHQCEEVKKEKQSLLIRLSQISSMQLMEGNPNIADLSDPNRPDKVAEQFSELYDNLWTESFQVLCERRGQQEEKAINVLLKLIMAVYETCRSYADNQNRKIIKSMCMFTGMEVGDSIIRESMHNLLNFRAKHFSSSMADVGKVIEESLPDEIGSNVYIDCQDYLAECTKVCWLMCIKSPPMYISAATTDKFDHNLYTSYTKSGTRVSYVVWPTLFQYENGPIMKKGVAQGI